MREQGFQPNLEIFTALVGNASVCLNPKMLMYLLKQLDKWQIAPSRGILARIEKLNKRYQGYVLDLERQKPEAWSSSSSNGRELTIQSRNGKPIPKIVLRDKEDGFKAWREFREFYSDWLRRTEMDLEAEAHPWRQYINEKDVDRAEKGNREFSSIIDSGATVIPKS